LPTEDKIRQNVAVFQSIFDRYSNLTEEGEGLTLDDLIDVEDSSEEKLLPISEADESDEEKTQTVALYDRNFCELPYEKKYKKVVLEFSPEFVETLKSAFQRRYQELSRKHLPVLTITNER